MKRRVADVFRGHQKLELQDIPIALVDQKRIGLRKNRPDDFPCGPRVIPGVVRRMQVLAQQRVIRTSFNGAEHFLIRIAELPLRIIESGKIIQERRVSGIFSDRCLVSIFCRPKPIQQVIGDA